MAACIITESNVSKNILSFTWQNFLFTRTVCKSWYENGNGTATHVHRAVDSSSTVEEAYQNSYPLDVYAPYLNAIDNTSDISVFEHLVHNGSEWIDEDVEYAAEYGRIDVLQLFQENGQVLDERILHTAVRYGQLHTLVYLMRVGCPVDNTRIEWGFGQYVVEELKMCSLEMAARDGRVDIMKQLRTNVPPFTPFPHETLEYALEGRHLHVLKYIRDVHPYDVFRRFLFQGISDGDTFEVAFLVKHGLVGDTHTAMMSAFRAGDTYMVNVMLVSMTKSQMSRAVDQAIGSHQQKGVCLAKYLMRSPEVRPTSDAYNCLLRTHHGEEQLINILNWLHDKLAVRVKPERLTNLANHSPAVQQWFLERCRRCRLKLDI